ncbi:MAG TPA: ECF transporter S component [Flexivirga sp.]|uniref:ECF transporter S component n=1 Tax=Flexivirga sp. TaxID=1962927 RepID=UPI002BB87D12|nr:ECF transporter S component [Flexivirga sp.]HWC24507.1 ECF transporter S component [Flexivirga sp.]
MNPVADPATADERPDLVTTLSGHAVPLRPRSALVLVLMTIAGLAMFCWPLLTHHTASGTAHVTDAPIIFAVTLPLLVFVILAEFADGGMDSKALAILGVLSAVDAALRPTGGGTGGIETVFFLLILAGRVFGPGFGFVLGCTSLFASALITAGVGPWLPFQMLCSAWIGMGAGLLPRGVRGTREVVMLIVYGVIAAYAFGALMNLYTWPFLAGVDLGHHANLAYVPTDSLLDNLHRFGVYTLVTSTGGWDTGRAITNAVAIAALGRPVLVVLRRAARRASYAPLAERTPDDREDT